MTQEEHTAPSTKATNNNPYEYGRAENDKDHKENINQLMQKTHTEESDICVQEAKPED